MIIILGVFVLISGPFFWLIHNSQFSKSIKFSVSLLIIAIYLAFSQQSRKYSLMVSGATAWLLVWMAGFKILASVFGRGPLSTIKQTQKLVPFLVVLYFPVFPANQGNGDFPFYSKRGIGVTYSQCFLKLLVRLVLGVILNQFVTSFDVEQLLGKYILHMLYILYVMIAVDINVGVGVMLAQKIVGISLLWGFDSPWLSESFDDFWTNRWNTLTSMLLRQTVYEPILDLQIQQKPKTDNGAKTQNGAKVRGSANQIMLGVTCAFFVSGAMHQIPIKFMSGEYSMKMMLLFVLQPLLIYLERQLFTSFYWKQQTILKIVRWFITFFTLMTIAHFLFFDAFERNQVEKKCMHEIAQVIQLILKIANNLK